MVIVVKDSECILTDLSTMQEYTLAAEPQNNLKAHWDFRSMGKSQRYYIGSLLQHHNFDQIEWSEMRKKRKTDKWIRVPLDPIDFLKQCKAKNKKHRYRDNTSNRRIIRKKQNGPPKSPNNGPTYRRKQQQNDPQNQHGMILKRTNAPNADHNKHSNPPSHHFNDPAIMQVSNGNNQHRRNQPPKYQTAHTPHKNNQFYAQYYPKLRSLSLCFGCLVCSNSI